MILGSILKIFAAACTTIGVVLFAAGIYNIFVEVEKNACQMTYMYKMPSYTRLKVKDNKAFPKYGLYHYSEGKTQIDTTKLSGAPILFVPGNAGSYKQVRSLASVALRMGVDRLERQHLQHHTHLDYFSIDYNEELTGFYGGYLKNQKLFLELCIEAVMELYQKAQDHQRKIIIIGHSMGGIVAKSILSNANMTKYINTLLFISTPLDRPVINIDNDMNMFYEKANNISIREQTKSMVTSDKNPEIINEAKNNILLVSIGGGQRDLLVPAALTKSKISDIHAMTTAIPHVWLSCDHLSILWCLQLMKRINKFFFQIAFRNRDNYILFEDNLATKFQAAYGHFIGNVNSNNAATIKAVTNAESWHQDKRSHFQKHFKHGLNRRHNQLFPIDNNNLKQRELAIEVTNENNNDWLYGCNIAQQKIEVNETLICKETFPLTHLVMNIPNGEEKKSFAFIDLNALVENYAKLTHILISLPATRKHVSFRVDTHQTEDRSIIVKAPRWFDLYEKVVSHKIPKSAMHYHLHIEDFEKSFMSLKLNIKADDCDAEKSNKIAVRVDVPWAPGYERFHMMNGGIFVNMPISKPKGSGRYLNQSVTISIYLNAACRRLSISQQFSFADTLRSMLQQFYCWLPSYLTVIAIVVLKENIIQLKDNSSKHEMSIWNIQYKTLLIVIVSSLLKHFLLDLPYFDIPREFEFQFFPIIMIHGATVLLWILLSFGMWSFLKICSKCHHYAHLRCLPAIRGITKTNLLAFIIAFVSIALTTSCSGIGLALAFFIYLVILVNNSHKLFDNDTHAKQLSFHLAMLILLLILNTLSMPATIIWLATMKLNRGKILQLYPTSISTAFCLFALTLLWVLKAPTKFYSNLITTLVLNSSATFCILYCQEKIFLLNYVIAFAFISLPLLEIIRRLIAYSKICFLNYKNKKDK